MTKLFKEISFEFSRNNLDLIRLFAATQVVLMHAAKHLKLDNVNFLKWLSLFPGVPIFFFISGFLIYRSYSKSSSAGVYFSNRFLRIYPALWVCLLITILALFSLNYLQTDILLNKNFWLWFFGQASFVQFYNPLFLRDFGVGVVNGSLWTIAVELQFYLLTPLIFFLNSRWRYTLIASLLLFLFLNINKDIMPFNENIMKLYNVTFIPWFGLFLWGAWFSTHEDLIQKIVNMSWLSVLGIFVMVDILSFFLGLNIIGNNINIISFIALSFLIIKIAYYKPNTAYKVLKGNDISYGVYIYHMIIVNSLIFLGFTTHSYLLGVVVLITYLCALASWFYVEKPVLALKKNSIHSRQEEEK